MKTVIVELRRDDALQLLRNMEENNIIRLLDSDGETAISAAHQELVLQRLEKARENPQSLLDWHEAKKQLTS